MVQIYKILDYLNYEGINSRYYGKKDDYIYTYCSINSLKDFSITFIRNNNEVCIEKFKDKRNMLIVCNEKIENIENCSFLCVDNPHKVFFKVLEQFFVEPNGKHVISKKSSILTDKIGVNVGIGEFSYIGTGVVIGDNVRIDNNVTIEGNVIIGDNTIIESGVVIGLCGFGHYKEDSGVSKRVPHLGGVTIGNDCYISSNCTIARGTLSDTFIGNDVKIDALCHIAHNVIIGDRVMITGGSKIAGSTIVKNDVWIGPNVTINNSLVIGEHSFIGIGSVVTKNVPDNKAVFGIPARILKDNTPNIYNT